MGRRDKQLMGFYSMLSQLIFPLFFYFFYFFPLILFFLYKLIFFNDPQKIQNKFLKAGSRMDFLEGIFVLLIHNGMFVISR